MSKKRFTEGLESLFDDSSRDWSPKERRSSSPEKEKESQESTKASSGKSFAADLQSFLQEAFEESFERQLKEKEKSSRSSDKTATAKPATGLDALIRNTLEPATYQVDPNATRKLVVTFRENQLQKLKSIAKLEKTYLKQIINDIVESFIEDYEKKQDRTK